MLMKKLTKWKETLRALLLYPLIRREIKQIDADILFFFPQYQTGGAERVHLNIMKSVSDKKLVCFITNLSVNKDLREEFMQQAQLINLHRWGWKTSFRKKMAKKLAVEINKIDKPVLFGSNSEFFYDLFPHLKADCVKIDLLHTDLSSYPLSIENYAAPHTHLLTQRVVLGEGHREKLTEFYVKKDVPLKEIDKVRVIPNGIAIPDDAPDVKDYSKKLRVLFVGRNSHEKRPEVFVEVAREALRLKLPFIFQMIGDFDSFSHSKPNNLEIIGKITDVQQLNAYYEKAHFIFITSLFEGFPMVLSEGMSHGVIPVAVDVGEISRLVNEESKTGFIIPNFTDVDEIVNGFIHRMQEISENRTELPSMASKGYELVKTEFSLRSFSERYHDLLTKQARSGD